jgi:hypothetical protein
MLAMPPCHRDQGFGVIWPVLWNLFDPMLSADLPRQIGLADGEAPPPNSPMVRWPVATCRMVSFANSTPRKMGFFRHSKGNAMPETPCWRQHHNSNTPRPETSYGHQ